MKNTKQHILILPRWYPNKEDIQLGIFIRNQAKLISSHYQVSLVYVQADATAQSTFELLEDHSNGFHELVVYFKSANGPLRKWINYRRYRKAQKLAYAKVKGAIDLCHVHVPYRSAGLALELLRTKNIPFLITEHWSGHLNGLYQQKNAADKKLYKKIVGKATAVSTVSQLLQQKFKSNTGYDSVVIPNYIEKADITSKEQKSDEKIRILSVSDFYEEAKNISGLLSGFHLALLNLKQEVELKIVGDGPDREKIQEFYSRLGFEKNQVVFTGRAPHEEVLDVMNQCDFYICNSNFETFGMTVAEALLAGKPVICTNCGGPEEFLNSNNSIQIEKKNDSQLSEAIQQMCTKYQNYDSSKISSEIEARFGKEAILKAWIDFYSINK
ncbi:MAG: glycosyltransferase [Flavobacteriales bacterium]|nr:glycosyltransferase [Flavobacteriales bacterium]